MSSIRNVFIGVLNHTFSAYMYKQKMTWIFLIDCCSKKKCQITFVFVFSFFPFFCLYSTPLLLFFYLFSFSRPGVGGSTMVSDQSPAGFGNKSSGWSASDMNSEGMASNRIWRRNWKFPKSDPPLPPAYISSNPVSSLPLPVSPSPPIFLFPDPYNQANNPVNLSHSAQNPKGF